MPQVTAPTTQDSGQDVGGGPGGRVWNKQVRQGIRLNVLRTRTIGQREVKSIKEEGPSGLSGIETFSWLDVFQVLVISPNQERVLSKTRNTKH